MLDLCSSTNNNVLKLFPREHKDIEDFMGSLNTMIDFVNLNDFFLNLLGN